MTTPNKGVSMKIFKILALIAMFMGVSVYASDASVKLDRDAEYAVKQFYKKVNGGNKFLSQAKGYLVFPSVTKAGFVVGGSYGEGVLRVQGQTKSYYSVTSGSIGFQAGAQQYSMIIAFLTDASLRNFMKSDGWEAGMDGSLVISDKGFNKDISSISYEKPIIVFAYGTKGLMGGISVKGNKFKRIIPQ